MAVEACYDPRPNRATVQLLMSYRLRAAVLDDRPSLTSLIARSARALSTADYRAEQIEGALRGAFGVDTQLIHDCTYFVIEAAGEIVACGGWSYRRTLFGSDSRLERDAAELDPRTEPAKIRAFFVHPQHTRKGLGTMLLQECEREARGRGFARAELMGTLPGVRLYAARGYVAQPQVLYEVSPGVHIEFVPMVKVIGQGV
jgi:GNAT superfamily N-acetyltransferase